MLTRTSSPRPRIDSARLRVLTARAARLLPLTRTAWREHALLQLRVCTAELLRLLSNGAPRPEAR